MHQQIARRALAAWIVLAISSFLFAGSSAPQVKTRVGTIEGKDDGKVKAFLGIPYAAPPVGGLRWKAPAPAAKWTGVKKATEFGSHCLQGNVFGDMVFHDPGGSEDCLTLNVWVPDKHVDPKLPVMAWIYCLLPSALCPLSPAYCFLATMYLARARRGSALWSNSTRASRAFEIKARASFSACSGPTAA